MTILTPLRAAPAITIAAMVLSPAVHGQVQPSTTDPSKVVNIGRTDTPPDLDGVLDDAVWRTAASISDMHQFFPIDHATATQDTVVYLAYDDEFLYVGARLLDSEPDQITARVMAQGESIRFDDAIGILLDTFNNKRTGYFFQVNPNGVREEGVYETPAEINRDWEGVWFVETSFNDEGWAAEFAVPFRTLNFDEGNTDWGFTLERKIARTQEEIAWVSYNLQVNPGASGRLTGLDGMNQGLGLDIVPSVVTTESRDFDAGTSNSDIEPTLDVFYKFTPSLTGVLTLNTDFSATEVDDRQINLTRFSLFFPEKRDFFLQDVDIFSFGGLDRNGIPFFSRRIGLGNRGQPVDLDVGAKLTGRVGRWNIGVLNVRQDEFQGVDASNMFVGRVAANVLEESSVGLIATNGDPRSNVDNSLVGVDFRYRNTRLPSGRTLQGEAWYQKSSTDGIDDNDEAFGIRLDSPNEVGLQARVGYTRIEENFNPGLGFVNRSDIEQAETRVSYANRLEDHRFFRTIEHTMLYRQFDEIVGTAQSRQFRQDNGLDDSLQSSFLFLQPIQVETNSGDEYAFQFRRQRELLTEAFEIVDGVTIPAGDYEFDRYSLEAEMAGQRAFSPSFEYAEGDFYDGERIEIVAGFDWRPTSRINFGFDYEYNDIELLAGSFVARVIQIDANYAFNARWSWANLIQYDNDSESAGINSRLRWNPRAGQDLFIVLNYGFDSDGVFSNLETSRSDIAVKYTHTFRY